jgi:hypothetical protein
MPNPRRPEPKPVPPADTAARIADEAMRASLSKTTLRDLLKNPPPPNAAANG